MIRLFSRGSVATPLNAPRIGRITTVDVARSERPDHVLLVRGSPPPEVSDYAGVLAFSPANIASCDVPATVIGPELAYLADGDVVRLSPGGRVSALYRRASRHNTILATERCNSLCLMCSQPPQPDDDSHRVGEICVSWT